MKPSDIAALMKGIAPVLAEEIQAATVPLLDRIKALESELAATKANIPQPVEDYVRERDLTFITRELADQLPGVVKTIRLDLDAVSASVAELAAKAPNVAPPAIDLDALKASILAEIPTPQDGKSVDSAEVKAMVGAAVSDAVAALPPGKDGEPGKDIDPEQVAATIRAMVAEAVAEIPTPQDGKSVTVDDVAPMISAEVAKAVSAIPAPVNGKDGIGLAGAIIDRSGNLVITMTNGEAKELGRVVGENGLDVDTDSVQKLILDTIAAEVGKIPVPKDGRDGLGFDDLDVTFDGERTFTLAFARGSERKEFTFTAPAMIYRGYFKADQVYAKGDAVTFGGCLWHCNSDGTTEKPAETPDCKAWTMAARKGRDGKNGINGIDKTAPVKLDPEKK